VCPFEGQPCLAGVTAEAVADAVDDLGPTVVAA
jgi:hypothetical protein